MNIKDLVLFLPRGIISSLLKIKRENVNLEMQKYIENNGLYHITKNSKTAKKIIETETLKATKSVINSYGKSATFMFAGLPNFEDYLMNIAEGEESNILLHPEEVIHAVKIEPEHEEIKKLKIRSLVDQAIIHEGDFKVPKKNIKEVQLVLDLLELENGEKKLGFRERTEEEKSKDTDIVEIGNIKLRVPGGPIPSYTPTKECLETIEEERKQRGYAKKGILGLRNDVNTMSDIAKTSEKHYLINLKQWFKEKVENYNKKKIEARGIKVLPEGRGTEETRKAFVEEVKEQAKGIIPTIELEQIKERKEQIQEQERENTL